MPIRILVHLCGDSALAINLSISLTQKPEGDSPVVLSAGFLATRPLRGTLILVGGTPRIRFPPSFSNRRHFIAHESPHSHGGTMADRTPFEREFDRSEEIIGTHSVRAEMDAEGNFKFTMIGEEAPPADKLKKNKLNEWWIHQYILAHHKRLGFSHVEGPNNVCPDFRVKHKGVWHLAEAELDWKRYVRHKHHKNDADTASMIDLCKATEATLSEFVEHHPPT